MARFIRIASVEEVSEPGSVITASDGDHEYAISNIDGTYHVIDNDCIHQGGPLGLGTLKDGIIECPWHAWHFDAKTGACLTQPGKGVKCYKVKVEDGEIKVEIT
ncbi:MAG TPA: non-heme iron oxygenase ferredoxin subunit [Nitrospirales bacterium]|jgi:nitrite reductase/ring-hydroxylating ferredoxin subunit|nr:non-heme iron oxygenase ferredoxin subunit [Nitrospirales bacterium]HIA13767.1 non-heme iron oxygenase ferredoxin subunit [Nitrospirales bacterium]HIB55294.1 non-heme iron oxygenase ferredoxin subunit [Nitrospirales bacterium]HIC04108.1 non-heme iron oxygenase ferredoxin subunit [Nitrospirales bacterium]HIN33683.1 non-heme iron oxygenase ferredoxin subunit [Nitrospirales bacterium]